MNDALRHLGANSFSRLPSTLLKSLRAIQAYAGAVNGIGDRDADAATDDETASAVKHQIVWTTLKGYRRSFPNRFGGLLLPLKTSNTLKMKKQNQKSMNKKKNRKNTNEKKD